MLSDLIVLDQRQLADRLAELLERDGQAALTDRPIFAVALSGGSLATTFFPRLAHANVDWSRTHMFWIDERAVPPDHPDSNYGQARSLWLDTIAAAPERVHRMPADDASLDAGATAYSDDLVRVLGTPPRFDLALVGVGPDGHVASLFPGRSLENETRWVVPVVDSPKPPARRLTLTLPTLASARHVAIVALGDEKSEVIAESVEQPQSLLPLAILIRHAPHVTMFLDPAAAARLERDR